jgi:hypothetical protein
MIMQGGGVLILVTGGAGIGPYRFPEKPIPLTMLNAIEDKARWWEPPRTLCPGGRLGLVVA